MKPSIAALLSAVMLFALTHGAEARRTGALRTSVDMIVIHTTGGPTCDASTQQFIWVPGGELNENIRTIEAHPVLGIHYMIDRDGTLRRSIPENQIGHHVKGYSERSIAIELINHGDGDDPFPSAQIDALVTLMRGIVNRHNIARTNVQRHSDLDRSMLACRSTQRRKVDPGPAYPHDAVLEAVYSR